MLNNPGEMVSWRQEVDAFKKDVAIVAPRIWETALRIGFFGSVGGGKSVTAGICAIGITPEGKIGWVDGEGRRSGWAISTVADMAAGRYGGSKQDWQDRFQVVHLDPPFNPLRVVAATEALEEAGCKTIIEDVLTQAWDSDGGYLDLKDEELSKVARDQKERERKAASVAARIKPWTHGRLVSKINYSRSNIILLFQAKQKFNPKTSKPDDFESPIQESGLTRTAIAVGRVEANENGVGGFCSFELPPQYGTKFTHPSILRALPQNGYQFSFEHAEALLRLCGGTPLPIKPNAPSAGSQLNQLKAQLWELTKAVHLSQKGDSKAKLTAAIARLEEWLLNQGIMSDSEVLGEMDEARLAEVVNAVKEAGL